VHGKPDVGVHARVVATATAGAALVDVGLESFFMNKFKKQR
jgi:hypothetical protein